MPKNIYLKNVLIALVMAVASYILLNITFILYAFLSMSIGHFLPAEFPLTHWWFPPLTLGLFIIIIAIISVRVFKSKLKDSYKAIYSSVPLAVVYVALGIALFHWPVFAYGVNILVFGAVIFYLYTAKMSWFYYYTVTVISLALLIFTFLGGQI